MDYTLQALDGLAHAHAVGIIHRDLKPANLFLAIGSDGQPNIKVLDFGIAHSLGSEDDAGGQSRIVGSPLYMSPEQLRRSSIDPRTDVWSLGVVMFELLTGAAPFEGSFAQMVQAILSGSAPTVRRE